ncbi:MAG: transporter substrate-binding domain-containing protein [Parachlamydiales bacterium]|jgi:ABC-type amino acid transport substrate-binding protein
MGKIKALLLSLGLFLFTSGLFSAYPPDLQKIIQSGTLRIGMIGSTNEFPFFFLNAEKQLVGLDIDLANELAAILGVKVVLVRTAKTYQGVVDQVERGEVDLGISILSGSMDRAKKNKFSHPYVTLYAGLLVNRRKFAELEKTGNFFKRLNSPSATIGYLADSSYEESAKSIFPNATLKGFPYQKYLIEEVKKGTLTAGLVDEKEIKTFPLLNPNDILYVETVELRDYQDPICIFVAAEKTHLLFFVNAFLERREKLSFNEIIKKYYTPEAHE